MQFKDPATDEQLRIRETIWESIEGLVGKPKTAQLIDLILKTCREALNNEYFVVYHDFDCETDLLLLVGKKMESGLFSLDSILINDMFQKEESQNA